MKKTDVYYTHHHGAIAQLARASHWQCEGREFESLLLHQNLLIAKDLQIKSLAIFFLYPLQLQALAAFAGQSRDCHSQC